MASLAQLVEFNEQGPETILFVHSSFGSAEDWSAVVLRLLQQTRNYHVLLPTLHPYDFFSPEKGVSVLSQIIREKAKNGISHIVGLGIGAHIAVLLAQTNAHMVRSLCLTGYYSTSSFARMILGTAVFLSAFIALPSRWKACSVAKAFLSDFPAQGKLTGTIIAKVHIERKLSFSRRTKFIRSRLFANVIQSIAFKNWWNEFDTLDWELDLKEASLFSSSNEVAMKDFGY